MHIISISWVRNEADVIEAFVRHHSRIVDRMVIIDNASTDATREILRNLHEEGLPIEVRHDESTVHRQGEALTALMHEIALRENPNWMIPLDADEFLTGRNDVRTAIADLPADHVSLIPWKTYVPTDKDDLHEANILKRITHRRSVEQPQYHKILIPRAFHGAQHTITLGSHTLEHEREAVPSRMADGLFLAHFPVRSPLQIQRKITESWERYRADPVRKAGQGFHWEMLYDELCAGAPTDERFREIALYYAMPEIIQVELQSDPVCLSLAASGEHPVH